MGYKYAIARSNSGSTVNVFILGQENTKGTSYMCFSVFDPYRYLEIEDNIGNTLTKIVKALGNNPDLIFSYKLKKSRVIFITEDLKEVINYLDYYKALYVSMKEATKLYEMFPKINFNTYSKFNTFKLNTEESNTTNDLIYNAISDTGLTDLNKLVAATGLTKNHICSVVNNDLKNKVEIVQRVFCPEGHLQTKDLFCTECDYRYVNDLLSEHIYLKKR
jgi:hypothetical protein